MGAGSIAGRLQTLEVDAGSGFVDVLGIVDGTLSLEGEELDTTCHDSGRFRDFIAGRAAGTVDITALWDDADPGQEIVKQSIEDGTKLTYRFRMQVLSGADEFSAQGIVTSTNPAGPNDSPGGMDFSIRLAGAITRGAQA
jgi:predicted secreted protein